MNKLKLTLDELSVESFDTTSGTSGRAGTVHGNAHCCCCCCNPCCCAQPSVAATCQASCNGTCEASCGGTCAGCETYYDTCAAGCGVDYTYGNGPYPQMNYCYIYGTQAQ